MWSARALAAFLFVLRCHRKRLAAHDCKGDTPYCVDIINLLFGPYSAVFFQYITFGFLASLFYFIRLIADFFLNFLRWFYGIHSWLP